MLYKLMNQISQVDRKRDRVYKEFINKSSNIKSGVITKISAFDLRLLYAIYDDVFFENYFKNTFKGKVDFSLSNRMTRSAGKTIYPKNIKEIKLEEIVIEIRMGMSFFFKYYETNKQKEVNGILTKDSLEAFLLVFEHELCHLIELIYFKDSSCKNKRFKQIANNIFGHKDVYHKLPTGREIAQVRYGIRLGTPVIFEFEGKKLAGIVNNINKHATVMVRNAQGHYLDEKGNKFMKYYVPLEGLEVISGK